MNSRRFMSNIVAEARGPHSARLTHDACLFQQCGRGGCGARKNDVGLQCINWRWRSDVTGFITLEGSLGGKWLELLKEIAPRVNRVAFLLNPATATYAESYLNAFKAAAASVAVEAIVAPVHDRSEFDTVIAAQAREPNSGLIVIADAFTVAYRVEITSLAARYRLPAIYPFRLFVEVGGLLSYGADLTDNFRTAATYVDRILNGAKPSELPVQAPVKFELAINLKTAKALGLDVPLLLQQRADAVIE
jgi:putative tryptophan/tyrosine transport system substrate-binding protein